MTPRESELAKAIERNPQQAADALAALQLVDEGPPLVAAALNDIARAVGRKVGEFWVETMRGRKALPRFRQGLIAQGVALDKPTAVTRVDFPGIDRFTTRAQQFRCRINRSDANGPSRFVGSGVLIGPTTVLTAWHVVAGGKPGAKRPKWPALEVMLEDRRSIKARVPPEFQSPCSLRELTNRFPESDAEVADHADVAVLKLAQPVGALLATAQLPEVANEMGDGSSFFLVDFPDGEDRGFGFGTIFAGPLTRRRSHSIGTEGGSSGGGCFDAGLTLAGIHQGKDDMEQGRLVPVSQFLDRVREIVALDRAPPSLWSLDGTADGELVIGRTAFFAGFAAADREGRFRGIHVMRADPTIDSGGLAFSFRMLQSLVARTVGSRALRVSFEVEVPDLADEIVRRASDLGINIAPVQERDGVARGQTAPEAVGRDRGRRVAEALDAAAASLGLRLWVHIDHPATAFTDELRAAVEALIEAAMRMPHLRLVIVGFEATPMPGETVDPADIDRVSGQPGANMLVRDVISGFAESDIRNLLAEAADAAPYELSRSEANRLVRKSVVDISGAVNGVFPVWSAVEVVKRLRPDIRGMFP